MTMTFEQFVKSSIDSHEPNYYDPNGNSDRAVVTRMRKQGYLKAFRWELTRVAKEYKSLIKSFSGYGTPIGWFLAVPICTILLPVTPFIATSMRYREAVKHYREYYDEYVKGE